MDPLITLGLSPVNDSIVTFGLNLTNYVVIPTPIVPIIPVIITGGPSGGSKYYNNFIKNNDVNDYKRKKKIIRMLMQLNDSDLKYDYETVDKYIKAKIFNIDESFSEKKIIRVLMENVEDL